MAPTRSVEVMRGGFDRVRHELLTALHFGYLRPGERAPSVRDLADRTGMNRKTVHRAYARLAREGVLVARPGSGTFVATSAAEALETDPLRELLVAANRCRATAASAGLTPDTVGVFLGIYLGDGLRGLAVTVTECNQEQLGLICDELERTLGLAPRPVLLHKLIADPVRSTRGSIAIVTTDCHRSEVAGPASTLGRPVFRLALDSAFPRHLVDHARRAPLLMVVRDRRFRDVFLRLLRQSGVSNEIVSRFRIVEPATARRLLQHSDLRGSVYLSPLVEGAVGRFVPPHLQRLNARWHLEPTSLERLRAGLALQLASRRHDAPQRHAPSA